MQYFRGFWTKLPLIIGEIASFHYFAHILIPYAFYFRVFSRHTRRTPGMPLNSQATIPASR